MSQDVSNLVNISRRRIAGVHYGVDRILKSDKKKAQQQKNQDFVVETAQNKTECDTQQWDPTEEQYIK